VECQRLNFQGFYGSGLEILGGTLVQTSSSKVDYFSNLNNKSLQSLRNATFIIENAKCIFYVDGVSINGDVKNSTFVSEKSVPFFGGKVAETFTKSFVNCSFYNVTPCATAGVVFTFDENCNFNYGSLDMQANGYLAYTGETVIKNIGGKDYYYFVYDMSDSMFKPLALPDIKPDIKCNENNILPGFFTCAHCECNYSVDLYTEHHYGAHHHRDFE
jgi:hypothetical protein